MMVNKRIECMQIQKKKKEGEEKKMTQEEMLLEAAQTGMFNFVSLV